MTQLFLDTEFTSLNFDRKLISLALVSSDETMCFYAELTNTYKESDCSLFVIDEVLPQLGSPGLPDKIDYNNVNGSMTLAQTRQHLYGFFSMFDDYIEIYTDGSPLDWPLFSSIFDGHNWPVLLQPSPRQICFKNEWQEKKYENFMLSQQARAGFRVHHALDDAVAICRSYKAMFNQFQALKS